MMEIPLFDAEATLRFERIILYPYPDLQKIWARCWVTAVEDQHPNIELRVLNPDGTEDNSVYMMMRSEQRIETTLHMRKPTPGTRYRVIAELTLGMSDTEMQVLDTQEFEMVLEFRNPDAREPGFGFGVDWDEWQQQAD
ncbi:MAG: hypothetical protein WDZ49_10090 [Litorilinea sp.]